MSAVDTKDEKQLMHLLNSKQIVDKQMHQTLLAFKRNYFGVLNAITSTFSKGLF